MSPQFPTGTLVEYANTRWRVQRALGVEAVLLRSDSGAELSVDPLALDPITSAAATAEPSNLSEELCYQPAEWERASRRRDIISALARLPKRTGAQITEAAKNLGVTPRQVWSLLRRYRSREGSVTCFLPVRNGRRVTRLSVAVEAIIRQAIDQHYAKTSRPSLQSLVKEVAGRCVAAKIASPSYGAVAARVQRRDQIWLAQRRDGSLKSRGLRLLTGAHPGANAPWNCVQIDSTPCDIRLVREDDRRVIGRPNVTFAIDLYSRAVLGFSVSLQAASVVTVATCIAHACLPKRNWLAQRDLASMRWPVWGKPVVLEYDQGPENEAQGIQRGLRLHGIKAKIRAKGHPEQHGTIERLIGTMMRRVHERRGTTNASVAARGAADPADAACLALPELERILALEIDSYNHTVHHGVGERPMDRYVAYYRRADLPDAERLPPFPPADRFLLDFLPYERRHLVRTGVRLFRVDYSSRDLLPMWRAQNQKKVARIVVYDPRSLATIWIADAGSGDYIAVPYRVPRPDMTLAESAAARRALQSSKAADRTEPRLFDNVQQVRAIEERGRTATARMKAERSKQARRSAVRPPAIPGAGDAAPTPHVPTISAPPSVIAFEDVEDL